MFFKGHSNKITKRLINIDFDKLSLNNTTIKGYGKADVVAEYKKNIQTDALLPIIHRT